MTDTAISQLTSFATPVGRVLIAIGFLVAGIGKIFGYAGTQGYMESVGVPGALLPLVIALEVFGALAIIVGFQTRLVAFALAGFIILSALIFHFDFGNQAQSIQFMKNFGLAGGFLFLVANGAGAFSIDNRGKAD